MEVTTAELAAMSSDALRQAVSRGRHADEFEKELGLTKTMNRMLMEQIEELKDKVAKEKEKRQGGGVSHENGRLEEDPEDDELPRLRLANESLHTRSQMLEAQVYEAARYNDVVASDLAQAKQQLKAQVDANSRLESKNAQLAYDIEVLQASSNSTTMSPRGKNGALRYSSHSNHHSLSLSPEAIAQLEAENRELSERVGQLQEKCESRKTEVKNLRANVTFMKAKMTELTAKIQSNEAVNDAALQKLKQHLASPPDSPSHGLSASTGSDLNIPGFSIALSPDGPNGATPEEAFSICGILDSEQLPLLETAQKEITTIAKILENPASEDSVATSEVETVSAPGSFNSLRQYFNSKLDSIDSTGSTLPAGVKLSTPGTSLHTISEDSTSTPSGGLRTSGSVPVSNSSAPGSLSLKSSSSQVSLQNAGSKWHEYDASFLVLSVMLIQRLTTTNERLVKKRREFTDLQEDFSEYKRSQATQTPRSAAGSRKMSAETQQITLQKKMNELERSVQSLTAASNEKETQLVSVRSQVEQLTTDLASKSADLEEADVKYQELEKDAEVKATELHTKAKQLSEARDAEELLKAEAASLLTSISTLETQTTQLNAQLDDSKKQYGELEQRALQTSEQVTTQTASITALEHQVSTLETQVSDLRTQASADSAQIKDGEAKLEESKALFQAKSDELDKLAEAKKSEIEAITAQSNSYAEEVKSTKASLEKTQNELMAKSNDVAALSHDLDQLKSEHGKQTEELDSTKSTLKATAAQLEETKSSLATKSDEAARLAKDLHTITQERDAQIEEIKSVKATLAATESQLQEAKTELTAKHGEIELLSQEVKQLTTDKQAQSEEITSIKSTLTSTESQLDETKTLLSSKTGEAAQLSDDLKKRVAELDTASETLKSVEASLASTSAQLDETKTSLAAKSNEASQLSQDVEQLQSETKAQKEAIGTIKSTLASTETELEETKTSLAASSNEASQLSSTIKQLTADKEAQSEEITSIKSSMATTQAQLEETKTLLSNKTSEAGSLSQQADALRDDKKALEESLSSTKSSLESTEAQLGETKKSLDAKTNDADQLSQQVKQLNTDKDAQKSEIATLQEKLSSTESNLNAKTSELSAAISTSEKVQSELKGELETLGADLESTKSQLASESTKLAQTEASLASLTKDHASQVEAISVLKTEKQAGLDQIDSLEANKRRLEKELEMRTEEALETVRSMTLKLTEVQTFKDGEIAQLSTKLDASNQQVAQRDEKISSLESDLAASKSESADRASNIASLEGTLASEIAEKVKQTQGREHAEKDASETKDALAQLQSTTAQSIALLEQSLHTIEHERSVLLARIDEAKHVEDNMHAEISGLQIKARELDAWQKKLPEINDESLEAEERAATKWLEYTLNKEKATTSHNSFATFLNQVAHGTQSPSSAAQLGGSAAVRKITKLGDSLRHPSFLASVINLVKKDAFSDTAIKKMEEVEAELVAASAASIASGPSSSSSASSSSTSTSAPSSSQPQISAASETETLRALEECLSVARSIGLKVNGVTGALLYQGNRRAIVDLSMEVIRTVTTVRASVRAHPELSLLFVGMEEEKMNAKSPDKVLVKWVNSFIEDYNATHPDLAPPRPPVSNLGRDLSDGRALGIVMAAINADWANLADATSLDLMRKIINSLQQTVWIHRSIPPFLDSPIPIMRGDENVMTILLAQLLEYNTGLSSPLAKLQSLHTSSTTASMLSATTPSRNQVRAVSGANMTDSPLKTPIAPKQMSVTAVPSTPSSSTAGRSATASFSSTPISAANLNSAAKTNPNNISIKPVEDSARWKFW